MDTRLNRFNLPIRIHYRPPLALMYFMSFIHGGALLCLPAAALSPAIRLLLMLPVVLSYTRYCRHYIREQRAQAGSQLVLDRHNRWSLRGDDASVPLTLLPGAYVHRLLVVLRFRVPGGKLPAFIFSRENVEHNTLRRLRVRLLHGNDKQSKA